MFSSFVPCFISTVRQYFEDMGHLSPPLKFLGRISCTKFRQNVQHSLTTKKAMYIHVYLRDNCIQNFHLVDTPSEI